MCTNVNRPLINDNWWMNARLCLFDSVCNSSVIESESYFNITLSGIKDTFCFWESSTIYSDNVMRLTMNGSKVKILLVVQQDINFGKFFQFNITFV